MAKVVILTGAGISAESGLKTFRGEDGLWEGYPVEQVASIEGFYKNPELVQKFYNLRRRQLKDPNVHPNPGHLALAEFEAQLGDDLMLVTQNIDNLHERGGSKNVFHMHGEINKVRCQKTEEVFQWEEDILPETLCPSCQKQNCVRPHIVWFGEIPFGMEEIYEALEGCRHFAAIGTSGVVYPAAGFVSVAKSLGHAKTWEVNIESTGVSGSFDHVLTGPASATVREFCQRLLKVLN